ncbi:efflux RND transporter periplasmic adaptor subunit, partial [Myxococcota bacterium]|nr:efflux RND transporter periplasmic adaptor subunit [Myxococcota bacterium]
MKSKTIILFLSSLFLFTSVACSDSEAEEKAKAEHKTTVRTEIVKRADIADLLTYVADLKPWAEVRVFSPIPDRILSFPWEDGQEISRGQRIASIRKEGLDRGLDQLSAQADGLDVQLRNLKAEHKRAQDLLAAGVITQQTFDQVQTSYDSLQAQRRALEAGQAQMAVSAKNAIITAPMSGVVADKMLQVGDMAVPQVPLCRILSIDKLKIELQLVETDVPKVRIGHQVLLHIHAYPNRSFEGTVTSIMPFLSSISRTNKVFVMVDNPRDTESGLRLLKPGMFGSAELVVDMHSQVLVVSQDALILDTQLLEKQGKGEILRKAYVISKNNIAAERLLR